MGFRPRDGGGFGTSLAEDRLNAVEDGLVDDAWMFAGMGFVLVLDPAYVGDVAQQVMQCRLGKWGAAAGCAVAGGPTLVAPAAPFQFVDHRDQRLVFQIQFEDGAHAARFGAIRHQLEAVDVDVIAQDGMTAGPFSLPSRRGNLVAHAALGDDLAFELGERQENIENQRPIELAVLNCWVTDTNAT